VSKAIGQAKSLLLLVHRDPDGDALGAMLGMAHLLSPTGSQVWAYACGTLPEEYRFLPGLDLLKDSLPTPEQVDLALLLDCHEPQRAGEAAAGFLSAFPRVAVVDHHLGLAEFGSAVWVDPAFAATSEMLALLAHDLGLAIGPAAATCLYTGLVTDTGRFSYSNTTPQCLRLGAELITAGADPWAITQGAYSTSLARLLLLGRVMNGLRLAHHGRVAIGTVSLADMAQVGAIPSDLDRIVEELRSIRGVEVAVLLREMKEGGAKASMRSRGKVDVGSLAIELGGGGHKNAAGARLEGDLTAASHRLEELLGLRLEGAE
jgi:phosphoesterase RecJ-like protein